MRRFSQRSASQSANTSSNKPCGKQPGLARLLLPIALASSTLGLATNPAQALTLFSDDYAAADWTQSIEGDGSIDISDAPSSITLVSADDGDGVGADIQNTDFTIAAPASGTVSFDWFYASNDVDGSSFDPFGYLLKGSFTKLTTDGSLLIHQSGTASFSVLRGDVFGFRQKSIGSTFGPASTTIRNFNGPVPGPLPLVGVGAAFGWSRRLRRRIEATGGVKPAQQLDN